MPYYAHSENKNGDKQLLQTHLNHTADLAADFLTALDMENVGYVLGLLHDAGKYQIAFQNRLNGNASPVDHKSYGAQLAVQKYSSVGKYLAYALAGHHNGLPNGIDDGESGSVCLQEILRQNPQPLEAYFQQITLPEKVQFQKRLTATQHSGNAAAMLIRMLFSALVDADYLDTERHFCVEKSELRSMYPTFFEITQRFTQFMEDFNAKNRARVIADERLKKVFLQRSIIQQSCADAASLPPGMFALNVPTGGGKTLSSMVFATEHAKRYGMRRIVLAVPFISVTEQNAAVLRAAFGDDAVVEHHSSVEPSESEMDLNRLACENWDAPLIVTTNVQLFESLYAHQTSKCRKLHNLANSIIILDEVQAIPDEVLLPCLHALELLCRDYGSTVVLCTATQPHYENIWPDKIEIQPIIPDPKPLFDAMKRTEFVKLGKLTDAELEQCLAGHAQVLCVVNTRKHAAKLFVSIAHLEGSYHLSARMCAAHRMAQLEEIRERLKQNLPCRVVSTQLIEAGVDVDFPVVYRASAGIDAIVQSAGRCNREGRLPIGTVYIFEPEDGRPAGWLGRMASYGSEVMQIYADPSDEAAIRSFYDLRFMHRQELDRNEVLQSFDRDARHLNFPFRSIGERFRLIDTATVPLAIPFDEKARKILDEMRRAIFPNGYARKLQRYFVNVYPYELNELAEEGRVEKIGDIHVLVCMEQRLDEIYDMRTGLRFSSVLQTLQL